MTKVSNTDLASTAIAWKGGNHFQVYYQLVYDNLNHGPSPLPCVVHQGVPVRKVESEGGAGFTNISS